MRRANIVCTMGPAVSSYEMVKALITAGMGVARLNMSHGTHDDHRQNYENIRRAAEELGRTVAILADLQGPKIRCATFASGPVALENGDQFTITTRDVPGDKDIVGTTYKGLADDVKPGDAILIDDGKVAVEVVDVREGTDVVTRVVVGGVVSNNKGLNIPSAAMSVPALSEKDKDDLRWALVQGVDFIALSFVREAADADDVHEIMDEVGRRVPVIAKIEKPQAVENLSEIVDAFDGMMVARGDLGVEVPLEEVPLVQKKIIEAGRRHAKPVIVATQVLDSMITNPRPTRAEASDAANAILDGADALMLSGETSVGRYPVETVETMAKIIASTEEHGLYLIAPLKTEPRSKGGVVCKAAEQVARTLGCRYLVTFTQSGDTARRMSRLRTSVPILAFTPSEDVRNQLALTWGVRTLRGFQARHTDEMVMHTDKALLASNLVEEGESVVIVAGAPPGTPGSTNTMRVHIVGEAMSGKLGNYAGYDSEEDRNVLGGS